MPIINLGSPLIEDYLRKAKRYREKSLEKMGKFFGLTKTPIPMEKETTTPQPIPTVKLPTQRGLKDYLKDRGTVWTSEMLERFYPTPAVAEGAIPTSALEKSFTIPSPPYGTAESKALSEYQRNIFDEQMKALRTLKDKYETLMDKIMYMTSRPGVYKKELKALRKLAPLLQAVSPMLAPAFSITPPVSAREQQIKELEALTGLALAPATRAKLLAEATEWKPRTLSEALLQTEAEAKAAAMPKILGGLAGTLGDIAFMPENIRNQILQKLEMEPIPPPTKDKTAEKRRGPIIDRNTFIQRAKERGFSEEEAKDFYDWNIAPY